MSGVDYVLCLGYMDDVAQEFPTLDEQRAADRLWHDGGGKKRKRELR
jgi:hypothetical protein